MTDQFRAMCKELVDSVELLLEMRAVDAKPMAITEDRVSRARALLAEPVIPVKQRIFPTPSQAAECGGPCYEGSYCPGACDCGVYQPPALAEPPAEGPSALELEAIELALWDKYRTKGWGGAEFMYDNNFSNALEEYRAALARWGRPTPQPEEGDIHYAWELHDAEGDWQAGGSADSLENVQREGNHYLKIYSQDGPHKLIIQRHCVSTIEEVTND